MTQKMTYSWKPRTSFEIDPQVAGEELERLRGHNSGDLTPEMVVSAAKAKSSPLHNLFEWDDKKAGHQYRLQQANTLIRAVVVMVSGGQEAGASEPIRATVTNVASRGGPSTARVVPPEELHRRKVDEGWSSIEEWVGEYGGLPEFAGVAIALNGFMAMRPPAKENAA